MGNHFRVTVSSMETAGNEMQRVFGDLRASCTEISALRSGLSFHTAADYRIKKRLADEISRITQEADHTEKMKEQLEAVLKLYVNTESRLAWGREAASPGVTGPDHSPADSPREVIDELRRLLTEGDFPEVLKKILMQLIDLIRLNPSKGVITLLLMMAAGNVVPADLIPGTGSGTQGGSGEKTDGSEKNREWEFSKKFIDFLGKYEKEVNGDKESGNQLGFGADALKYAEDLYKFWTGDKKGASGASDLCSLADSSCGVWNGFYKIVENKYKDLFKYTDQAGEHVTAYGKKMAGISGCVSIAGSLAGWGGDIADIFDDTKNPTGVDKNAAFISSTSHGVDIATTIYDLKSKTDASGLYTPAMLYGTVAESGIETCSVAYKDIRNLYADGSWSVDDTAQTMLDSSTAGLYKIVNKMTFGLVSEDTTGLSAQEISDTLKGGAQTWGKEAGNRVVENPTLHRIYQNGNGFTKGCVLTYSIIDTGFDYAKEGARTAGRAVKDTAVKAWNDTKDTARKAGEAIDSVMPWNWHW